MLFKCNANRDAVTHISVIHFRASLQNQYQLYNLRRTYGLGSNKDQCDESVVSTSIFMVFVRQPDRCGAALLVETEHGGGMDGMRQGLLGIGLWRRLRTHDLG